MEGNMPDLVIALRKKRLDRMNGEDSGYDEESKSDSTWMEKYSGLEKRVAALEEKLGMMEKEAGMSEEKGEEGVEVLSKAGPSPS